jgi:16S rRNA (guanine966-N2)-methyltransferase
MKRAGHEGTGEVRVIGGSLRGRKLRFPVVPGLRPTPDRVRETLFNWLQPVIDGARCLDLFAGSGALGVEALSRGASRVVFVEPQPAALAALQASLGQFGVAGAETLRSEAQAYLRQGHGPFDVVFVDPPFELQLQQAVIDGLAQGSLLAPGALVHVEQPRTAQPPHLPSGWVIHRQGTAGEVGYYLLRCPNTDTP